MPVKMSHNYFQSVYKLLRGHVQVASPAVSRWTDLVRSDRQPRVLQSPVKCRWTTFGDYCMWRAVRGQKQRKSLPFARGLTAMVPGDHVGVGRVATFLTVSATCATKKAPNRARAMIDILHYNFNSPFKSSTVSRRNTCRYELDRTLACC